MLKIHSGVVGLCGVVARWLPAKSSDLTDLVEKDLAIWKTESSLLRNPLRFLAQPFSTIPIAYFSNLNYAELSQ